ncbi:PLD nuclease N-terminal domain-containing protein [Mesonia sp. K4-1]|uniref:PLD nuclease N-terminal domain-containing protein n=1 Tax=Mesonia sp. K4-1 TaxID=2602760 RepID=UPI0011CB368D|nr:PLD nuclease N-terminal domain-containing protein [Mesonia sp. K4-1]TXK78497.1 PLDc_N domain-containing protein [Mesonia sp. K4-1]
MTLQTPLFLLILLIFSIFFIGGSLFLILKNEKESLPKVLWVLIVLAFPLVGAAVYYANAVIQNQRAKQQPAY